jgi:hypothetical protein
MNRLRPVVAPLALLACAAFLYWVNHLGKWHSNKAEGATWLFALIAVIWFPFAVYRVAKPLPISVGVDVVIMLGENEAIAGNVVKMEGDQCTVRTVRGDYVVNRYAIVSLVKKPA